MSTADPDDMRSADPDRRVLAAPCARRIAVCLSTAAALPTAGVSIMPMLLRGPRGLIEKPSIASIESGTVLS